MKIAVLNSSVSRANGGIFEIARRLAQELNHLDANQLRVLGVRDQFTADDAAAWAPLSVRAFEPRWFKPYGYAPGLSSELEAFRPDVCHAHGLWTYASLAARRWGQKTRTPFVITVHGMLDPWALAYSRWKKRLVAQLCERRNLEASACLHVNTLSELHAVRNFGVKGDICVIPNGVDLPDLNLPCGSPPWRSEAGVETKTLLYLGRLHPKKGLSNLLEAWKIAQPSGWQLVVAGWEEGGHGDALRSQARALGIEVVFPGPQFGEAKRAAFYHADAFILPSFSEGLPMVVLEAWAHRLPVIMTHACNLPAGFSAQAAVPIEPTVESIVASLQTLASMQAGELEAMGERGRKLVERDFSWPVIARELHEVFRWILRLSKRPACVSS